MICALAQRATANLCATKPAINSYCMQNYAVFINAQRLTFIYLYRNTTPRDKNKFQPRVLIWYGKNMIGRYHSIDVLSADPEPGG